MNTKLATALSMIGVLGAGTTAGVVNTKVLSADPAPTTVMTVAATNKAPETTSGSRVRIVALEAATPTTLPPTTPLATAAPTFATSFNVGEAGTVVVDVVDGFLVIASVAPSGGWAYAANGSADTVGVDFTQGTTRVIFTATLVDGSIVPNVETVRIDAPGANPAATGGAASGTASNDSDAANSPDPAPDPRYDDDEDHDGDDGDDGDDDEYDDSDDDGEYGESDDRDDIVVESPLPTNTTDVPDSSSNDRSDDDPSDQDSRENSGDDNSDDGDSRGDDSYDSPSDDDSHDDSDDGDSNDDRDSGSDDDNDGDERDD